MGSLAWEALGRLQAPAPVEGVTMMVVAAVGVAVNTITAWLFMAGSKADLNIRGAFLHMAADALVSLGVVLAGALYLWQGWGWIDPVVSLMIAAVIVIGTWSLLRRSLHLLFDGVPEGIAMAEVRAELAALPGVTGVHHVHVWATSTTERALTAHLVTEGRDASALLERANVVLAERFGITHATLQAENAAYALRHCGIASDHGCHGTVILES
jgi:cobalt-zinc-cadmium efflux system protein